MLFLFKMRNFSYLSKVFDKNVHFLATNNAKFKSSLILQTFNKTAHILATNQVEIKNCPNVDFFNYSITLKIQHFLSTAQQFRYNTLKTSITTLQNHEPYSFSRFLVSPNGLRLVTCLRHLCRRIHATT